MNQFASHCALVALSGIIAPRPVLTQPVRVNRSLLCGNQEQADAFAQEKLRQERQRAADIAAELLSEGKAIHHRTNFKE